MGERSGGFSLRIVLHQGTSGGRVKRRKQEKAAHFPTKLAKFFVNTQEAERRVWRVGRRRDDYYTARRFG
jgi:hypothetical protein